MLEQKRHPEVQKEDGVCFSEYTSSASKSRRTPTALLRKEKQNELSSSGGMLRAFRGKKQEFLAAKPVDLVRREEKRELMELLKGNKKEETGTFGRYRES